MTNTSRKGSLSMKRIFALLLAICLVALCGCSPDTPEETQPETQPTAAPTQPSTVPTQPPLSQNLQSIPETIIPSPARKSKGMACCAPSQW